MHLSSSLPVDHHHLSHNTRKPYLKVVLWWQAVCDVAVCLCHCENAHILTLSVSPSISGSFSSHANFHQWSNQGKSLQFSLFRHSLLAYSTPHLQDISVQFLFTLLNHFTYGVSLISSASVLPSYTFLPHSFSLHI